MSGYEIAPGVTLEPRGWASRLGDALREARERHEVSLRRLARESGGRFGTLDLLQFERGRRAAGPTLSRLLADLYQIDLEAIAPPRSGLEVDLEGGVLSAGGATRRLTGDRDVTEETLSAYLELVSALRGARSSSISLRRDDMAALGAALELDENAVAPERVLVERPKDVDGDAWALVERRLREAFVGALPASGLDVADRRLNGASATDQEIAAGALAVEDAKDHVVAVFREIDGLPRDTSAKDFVDLLPGGGVDVEATRRLDALKAEIETKLGRRLEPLKARWTGAGPTSDHLAALCAAVASQLTAVIARELDRFEAEDPLDAEVRRHKDFGDERAQHFVGRKAEIAAIASYLAGAALHPLVVQGESGCGKSALMAKVAASLAPAGATVIRRFIGATPASSDGRALLEGLLQEITRRTGCEAPAPSQDPREIERTFEKTLTELPDAHRLVVFLDALDQLSPEGQAWRLLWLPEKLPARVRLVVSVTPGGQLDRLRARLPEAAFVDVRPMAPTEADEALALWLTDARRTLQPAQRTSVLEGFARCPLPLYLRVVFERAVRWKSSDPIEVLPTTVPGVLRSLLADLSDSANHGALMVSRSLGLLAAARHGLAEDEMLDVLSADRDVLADFELRSPKSPKVARLPVVVWSRIRHDLDPYLAERAADGTSLLSYYHRQVREVVEEEFLAGDERRLRHCALAVHFASPKRTIVRREGDRVVRDLRMLAERVHQQRLGKMWNELEATLLDTFGFLEAKAEAGLVFELADDFRSAAAALPKRRERRHLVELLDEAIRWDIQLIARHPTTLFQCCWNSGWWYDCPEAAKHHEVDPKAKRPPPWARDGKKLCDLMKSWRNGRERRGVRRPWLREVRPPAVHLASPMRGVYRGHEGPVTSAAFARDGDWIVSASVDGTVRVWDAASGEERRCLRGHEGSVTSAAFSRDGDRIVSASDDATLRVWDAASGEELRCLRGHEGWVRSAAFSRDEDRIVSASRDGTLRVWDLATGECVRVRRRDLVAADVARLPESDPWFPESGPLETTIRARCKKCSVAWSSPPWSRSSAPWPSGPWPWVRISPDGRRFACVQGRRLRIVRLEDV